MAEYTINEQGHKVYENGAQRDVDSVKPAYHLIPKIALFVSNINLEHVSLLLVIESLRNSLLKYELNKSLDNVSNLNSDGLLDDSIEYVFEKFYELYGEYECLKAFGVVLTQGALKYGDRNWEKGLPIHHCLGSLYRHTIALVYGQTDENHLGSAIFNIYAIKFYIEEEWDESSIPVVFDKYI